MSVRPKTRTGSGRNSATGQPGVLPRDWPACRSELSNLLKSMKGGDFKLLPVQQMGLKLHNFDEDQFLKVMSWRDSYGNNLLRKAAKDGRIDTLTNFSSWLPKEQRFLFLLEQDEVVRKTILHCSAQHMTHQAISCLLEGFSQDELTSLLSTTDRFDRNLPLVFAKDGIMMEPFMYVIRQVRDVKNCSDLLISKGSDQRNCLHWAIQQGWVDAVKLMIEIFQNAERDVHRVFQQKNSDGVNMLGEFTKDMSREMKELLMQYSDEHLLPAPGAETSNGSTCLFFENIAIYGLDFKRGRYQHAWWRFGIDVEIFSDWSQEILLEQIRRVKHNYESIPLLMVKILAPGGEGMVTDCQFNSFPTSLVVEEMEKLPSLVPKVLIVETIPSDGKLSDDSVICDIKSGNFVLLTYTPKVHSASYKSLFVHLSESLNSICDGGSEYFYNMVKAVIRQVRRNDDYETPIFEATLWKTIIFREQQSSFEVQRLAHCDSGFLVHAGNGYTMKLKDSDGCNFYAQFSSHIRSLYEHRGIVYILTSEVYKDKCLYQLHAASHGKTTRSVLTFKGQWWQCNILVANHIYITTRKGIRVYSLNYKHLQTIKTIYKPRYIIQAPNDKIYLTYDFPKGTLALYKSMPTTKKVKAIWTRDMSQTVYGLACHQPSGNLYILIRSSDGDKSILVFNPNGEHVFTHDLPECKCGEVWELSIHDDSLVVANSHLGVQTYKILQHNNQPYLEYW